MLVFRGILVARVQIPGRSLGRACVKSVLSWALRPGRRQTQSSLSSPSLTPALEEAGPERPGGLMFSTAATIQEFSCEIPL